jgi:tetratricopeptide (TPR) repeat protein
MENQTQRDSKPSSFARQLRAALEHYHDVEWLGHHSPLAAAYLFRTKAGAHVGRGVFARRGALVQQTLVQALDELKSRGNEGTRAWQLIDLRYIQSKALEFIFDEMGVSRATFYRHETRALELFEDAIIKLVNPSIQLDSPPEVGLLIGRDKLLLQLEEALNEPQTIAIWGNKGTGKTALGAKVAERWRANGTFWYSFQIGLNDQLRSALFAIGYFLNLHATSSLWLEMVAQQTQLEYSISLGLLTQDLEARLDKRPLFCFDNLDILRPDASVHHAHIVRLLSDLHSKVPILLMGHTSATQYDYNYDLDFVAPNLTPHEIRQLLSNTFGDVTEADANVIFEYTDGNPLMVNLLSIAHRGNTSTQQKISVADALLVLRESSTVEGLVTRIYSQLNADEQSLLKQLSICRIPSPMAAWDNSTIHKLLRYGAVSKTVDENIAVLPAMKVVLQRWISPDEQKRLHLTAAQIFETRANHAMAIYHYANGGVPANALQLWRLYKTQEINQGNAAIVASIFDSIPTDTLEQSDLEILSLERAELLMLLGDTQRAIAALDAVTRSEDRVTSIIALDLRAAIAISHNETSTAIPLLEQGLEQAIQLNARTIAMCKNLSVALRYEGRYREAWQYTLSAQCEIATAQGFIKYLTGDYVEARRSFESALVIAIANNIVAEEAKVRTNLADLLKVLKEYDLASQHLEAAIAYYEHVGDVVNAAFAKSNLAAIYIESNRIDQALPYANDALHTCERLNIPIGIARTLQVLAQAFLVLQQYDQAETYSLKVVELNFATYTPYALLTIAEIRMAQQKFDEVAELCNRVISAASLASDRYAEAFALRFRGKSLAETHNIKEAQAAFLEAARLFGELPLPQELSATLDLLRKLPQN